MMPVTRSMFVISIICAFSVKSYSLTYLGSHLTGGPLLLLLHFLIFELAHC